MPFSSSYLCHSKIMSSIFMHLTGMTSKILSNMKTFSILYIFSNYDYVILAYWLLTRSFPKTLMKFIIIVYDFSLIIFKRFCQYSIASIMNFFVYLLCINIIYFNFYKMLCIKYSKEFIQQDQLQSEASTDCLSLS